MRKRFGTKAQLEMIGIAIVVVIVVMGFLFILKAIAKPPSRTYSGFLRAHITQDILNSMIISDAACGGMDMTELLKACVEGNEDVECGHACIIFNESVKMLLNATLEEQRLPYRLRAYENDPPSTSAGALKGIYMEYADCSEDAMDKGVYVIKEKPGMLVIPTNIGDVKIMLEICSRPY